MTAPLRWGFLGASRIGRNALAPAVLATGQRLVAVAARDPARAEAFAADFGRGRAYGTYAALLCDDAVDAVYIALPNDLHLPWTLASLAAGKHVLCEKPLALNAGEVARMQHAEASAGRLVMEAFCHRFHPQFDRARSLLQQGAIGRVLAVQTHFVGLLSDAGDFRWQAAMGGGALYDLGCYGVSLMRGLMACEPLAATAWRSPRGDVDAAFSAQMDFGGGVTGQMFCSFEGVRQQRLEVLGTAGSLSLDWPFSTKGRETRLVCNGTAECFAAVDPYARMVAHFAQAVSGEVPIRHGLDDSLRQAAALDLLFAAAGEARLDRTAGRPAP